MAYLGVAPSKQREVALLAEGVDRNSYHTMYMYGKKWSPSSRRAWIEIAYIAGAPCGMYVALLAEGVDRNSTFQLTDDNKRAVALLAEGVDRNFADPAIRAAYLGRPPRGGRG